MVPLDDLIDNNLIINFTIRNISKYYEDDNNPLLLSKDIRKTIIENKKILKEAAKVLFYKHEFDLDPFPYFSLYDFDFNDIWSGVDNIINYYKFNDIKLSKIVSMVDKIKYDEGETKKYESQHLGGFSENIDLEEVQYKGKILNDIFIYRTDGYDYYFRWTENGEYDETESRYINYKINYNNSIYELMEIPGYDRAYDVGKLYYKNAFGYENKRKIDFIKRLYIFFDYFKINY